MAMLSAKDTKTYIDSSGIITVTYIYKPHTIYALPVPVYTTDSHDVLHYGTVTRAVNTCTIWPINSRQYQKDKEL